MQGPDLSRILVGVDGSRRGGAAADFAGRLAGATGARLIVASVYTMGTFGGGLQSGERAASLAQAAARRAARGPVECRIAPAVSPAEGLRALAAEVRADMVVLGSRHRGRLGEALAGGVGRRLLRGATFPVALVPGATPEGSFDAIGVLPGSGEGARRALASAGTWAKALGTELRIYDSPQLRSRVGVDLASGHLRLLFVPAWPHGLAGRLRGHATRLRSAGCVVVVVPAGAPVPASSATRAA